MEEGGDRANARFGLVQTAPHEAQSLRAVVTAARCSNRCSMCTLSDLLNLLTMLGACVEFKRVQCAGTPRVVPATLTAVRCLRLGAPKRCDGLDIWSVDGSHAHGVSIFVIVCSDCVYSSEFDFSRAHFLAFVHVAQQGRYTYT